MATANRNVEPSFKKQGISLSCGPHIPFTYIIHGLYWGCVKRNVEFVFFGFKMFVAVKLFAEQ